MALGELAQLRENIEWQLDATRGHPEWGLRDWNISAHANALYTLGQVNAYAGSLFEAREQIERSVEIARQVGDPETEAWAAGSLAEVACMSGDVSIARSATQRAFELAERLGVPFSRTLTHARLAWVQLLDGRPEAAAETFEMVRAMIDERGTGRGESARALAGLSECARAQGDAARAIELAEQGLAIAGELRTRIDALYCGLALVRALRANGDSGERIEPVVSDAEVVIEQTGARNFAPLYAVERAELAAVRGDDAAHGALLAEALELFRANGATAHAARVAAMARTR
jgi:tetratricopeptide (TPR) repeat protein